jgi:shikimate kinase
MHLKLKRTPGLFLAGFMASGKSTVGRLVADRLGWHFADIDSGIEREQGRTIRDIFEREGEAAFREIESAAIRKYVKEVCNGHPWVVALGGGALAQEKNWELIREHGVTVWLDCSFGRIQSRLENDVTRPLAMDRERLVQLYEARQPLYARADYRVDADCDNPAEVVERILQLPIF